MDLYFDRDTDLPFCIEVGYFDTIKEIKEKVSNCHGIPFHEQTLKFNGNTLPDDLNIHTSNILNGSRLNLITTEPQKPQKITTTTITTTTTVCSLSKSLMGNDCFKRLNVNMMSKCGEKITLEVNPFSNVGELRKELQKVRNEGSGFRLPENGEYFFIYKQNVMEEDESFRWHGVAQGDTIEIFNGSVTG